MSQSSWILNQADPYQIPKLLVDQDIQKVLQNISKTGQKQIEIELKFKTQSDLNKFMKIYQQQMYQEQYDYLDNQKSKQQSKFKKCKDIDEKDMQVRQLAFPSYHFVNIFMKIYEARLRQLQIQYQYRFFIHRNKFRVYFPKGSKISSFFKNQIFQMKTKLNLYYCNDQIVIDKIKYSAYFNSLIQKKQIAAEYHKRTTTADVAIFYSNAHQKKNIIEIVNKNLLEHMTILQLADKNLKIQTNQIIFKLLYSLLIEKIKQIQKNNDVLIQANYEICCILVHDKHQCFVDAKNQVMAALQKTISFKLDGKNMRNFYNKVIRNHQKYPFLRVKYSHRSFYCVIDYTLLESNRKNIMSLIQLLLQYFQSFTHNNQINLFLKISKFPSFLDFYFKVSTDKNIQILNFNEFTMNQGYQMSKIILGVKDIGQLNAIKTRKDLFETFLKIILKTQKVNHLIQNLYLKFENNEELLGFQNPDQFSTLISQSFSQADKIQNQENFRQENQKNSQDKVSQVQINSQNQSQKVPYIISRSSSPQRYKQRQKKPKNFDISYDYKQPYFDSQLKNFWNLDTRQRKLQKLFCEKYRLQFGKLNFKIFKLSLKQKIDIPSVQDLEKDKIYISTIIEKNNEICHHLIDLNEFSRICNEVKDKTFFVFYKFMNQQVYTPSFALVLI